MGYGRSRVYSDPATSVRGADIRLSVFFICMVLMSVLVVGKLLYIQLVGKNSYYGAIETGAAAYEKFDPLRGDIFVVERNNDALIPIAENKGFANVYAVPHEIEEPYFVAKELASLLNIDEGLLIERLTKKGDPYEPIKNKLSEEEEIKIQEKGFSGIYIEEETYRNYPLANSMSSLTGFVGYTEKGLQGQYGVEGYFEDVLKGDIGYITYANSIIGNLVNVVKKEERTPINGESIVLTIDRVMQFKVCESLEKGIKRYEAESGTVILMEVETGKISALCSLPSFDANNYFETEDITAFNNSAIFEPFEPGSVFKAFTMASAINEKKVTPSTTYDDEGSIEIGEFTISNVNNKPQGQVDMVTILADSLNTGAVFVADQMEKEVFTQYVESFGFGKKTGIELFGEQKGTIDSLYKRGDIYVATASFGQGITATPMQLIAAYGVLARGGMYIPPTIIEKRISEKGEEIIQERATPQEILEPRAATLVTSMLVKVIDDGQAKSAGVENYILAGKTGTAQIANTNGKGYSDRTNHSFIGYGPVDNPKFVLLVKLENPKTYDYSSGTAAPLFGEIAKYVLQYYNIAPNK